MLLIIYRCRLPGVEGVAMEVDKGTMTVVGRFDTKKLRDRVANKTRKKVDLVGNNNAGNKGGGGGGGNNNKGGGGGGGNHQKGAASEEDGKPEKDHDGDKEDKWKGKGDHKEEDKGKDNKGGGGGGNGEGGKGKGGGKDNKKPAVPVVGTVVLKIGSTGLHCEGCMNRIRSKLFKIKGVEQVKMDVAKNQVTVTGTMDAKALPEKLHKKLRRPVDVVPAKEVKDKDGKQQDGGGKDKDAATKKLTAELEAWKAAFYDQQSLTNAEFMLSDENPNACAVM
ncbi:heavy metal-associated isoprenylated plant protein 3-like [Panicum virgatum]|uniref:heavy metal-associated isoprenylated plant protein 3-like n=1 Tax=Panicum virgatum TaxID=38727 RepID=UPI0019D64D49|nr:heavy metal-associated isoprenylated plant protein 3-like [Panicum virgatum]